MGITELILAIFIVCKLLGVGAAATLTWWTIIGFYLAFYGVLVCAVLFFLVLGIAITMYAERL